MARRHFILIDATGDSHAPFFQQTPIFQTWLRSYNNVADALLFIKDIIIPNSIDIYIARDNILDDGLSSKTNGQTLTLLDTFCDLETVKHITVYCPNINTDELEQQIHCIMSNPRTLKKVVPVIDLHAYMCKEGREYFTEERNICEAKNEIHLMKNIQKNIDELMDYEKQIIDARRRVIDALEENYSNKPGEEPL